MASTSTRLSTEQRYGVIAAAGLLALLVGLLLAPTVAGVVSSDDTDAEELPAGSVAVVTVEGPVLQPLAEGVESELRDLRANDSIEAVVIEIDTAGGQPAASERMYSALQQTNEEMPVIASVQSQSLSGGYYAMLGVEDIYLHPTSATGSVGVNAFSPEQGPPVEGPSGPDKVGENEIEALAEIELLGEVFIESVMQERGDRIELSREEVATADVFTGLEAVDNGMADELGTVEDAVADAADRAGVDEYGVVKRDVTPDGPGPILIRTDERVVAVHDSNPGVSDIEPLQYAMVHEPSLPHYDTVERFIDLGTTGGVATDESSGGKDS